jgi:acyl-CoA dehydrogenase
MPLLYSDSQQAIAIESRRILEARMNRAVLLQLLEKIGEYHAPYWQTAIEQGWCGITIAESYGGLGLGLIELGLVAHQIGRSIAGAAFLTSSFGVAYAIQTLGGGALKATWLPKIANGEVIGAVAFAEGQLVIPHKSTVQFANGTITGCKPAVSGGAHAQLALILATDVDTPLLALATLDDVKRTPINTYDNSRCAASLLFANTPAIELARGVNALEVTQKILALQAVITAHEQTGGAEALMEEARDYALTRRAFGQQIGAFQSVKHRIAELYALVELARANALYAATRFGKPDFMRAAAAARLQATEAYDTAARDTIQIHGGIGVTWDTGLHLHMRRARTLANEQGNIFYWEDVLVDELEGVSA